MFYDALSRNTVKITLTEADMQAYSLKSDCISGKTAETKRILTRFLKKFQKESSFFSGCSPERLFLEAFPQESGGCVLYVSTLGTPGAPGSEEVLPEKAPKARPLMCSTDSFDALARLCLGIVRFFGGCSTCLYKDGVIYRLVAVPPKGSASRLSQFMSEYGEVSDSPLEICSTAEQGELICPKKAAEMLAQLA